MSLWSAAMAAYVYPLFRKIFLSLVAYVRKVKQVISAMTFSN
jgi:hypothetical protein